MKWIYLVFAVIAVVSMGWEWIASTRQRTMFPRTPRVVSIGARLATVFFLGYVLFVFIRA